LITFGGASRSNPRSPRFLLSEENNSGFPRIFRDPAKTLFADKNMNGDSLPQLMAIPLLKALPDPLPAPASTEAEQAARLLAGIARQDGEALRELYSLWSSTLMGIAMKILKDRGAAEEVLQDTFVRVWRRAGEFDPRRGQGFVWACTMLRGLCLDHLRYHSCRKRGGGRIVAFDPLAALEEPSRPAQVMAADELRRVEAVMHTLDPADRECLQLAVFFEYTHSEIAENLRTPLGTVKQRLRRALGKLRAFLTSHES
jgi:RNA polymerase sigma-70 factor (ECF subfamily)